MQHELIMAAVERQIAESEQENARLSARVGESFCRNARDVQVENDRAEWLTRDQHIRELKSFMESITYWANRAGEEDKHHGG